MFCIQSTKALEVSPQVNAPIHINMQDADCSVLGRNKQILHTHETDDFQKACVIQLIKPMCTYALLNEISSHGECQKLVLKVDFIFQEIKSL